MIHMKNSFQFIFSSLLVCLFLFSGAAFAQTVNVEKDGINYVCKNVNGSWKPGKIQKKKFITYKKLSSNFKKLFASTGINKYNNQSKKMQKLHVSGLVACNHTCGNGVVDVDIAEQCDDGNTINEDSCTNICTTPICGDGVKQSGEQCDDGNNINDDACSNLCNIPLDVQKISAGFSHTCVLLDTGAVRCWGEGFIGKLGYATVPVHYNIGDDETPASVGDVIVGGNVVDIATGGGHTCALLDTGKVRCWGSGNYGVLGYGSTASVGYFETPANAGDVNVGGTVTQISAGSNHTCALLNTGQVKCWGYGRNGQLGNGNTTNVGDDEAPANFESVIIQDYNFENETVTQIVAGSNHTCALVNSGNVKCWGDGYYGQLGHGGTYDIIGPLIYEAVNIGGNVVQLAASGNHTCALLDTGNVRCWGEGSDGELGYGNTNNIGDNETPANVGNVNVGGTVVQIATGFKKTCALLDTGNVRCWGRGLNGQLGYGNTNNIGDNETPASVGNVNVGGTVVQLAAGGIHTCVLLDTGSVRCWGSGEFGSIGYGNTNNIGDNETPASAGDVPVL